MYSDEINAWVGVFSARRPQTVETMQTFEPNITWYVCDEQDAEDYAEAGAAAVKVSGALCPSRNAVIEDAQANGHWTLMLSDDMTSLKRAVTPNNKDAYEITLAEACQSIRSIMEASKAKLGGVAPTSNAFYFHPSKVISYKAFILGDFCLVSDTALRFDEGLLLKEDYDYTLQHIKHHGLVVRANDILANFIHRSNSGGAVRYRTREREQEAIAHLKGKWGKRIRHNPRRANEILLNLR
jgi:hypothetical protein